MSEINADIDVEQLLQGIEDSPSSEIPMQGEMQTETLEPEAPAEPAAPEQVDAQQYEVNWNGKKIGADFDKFQQWAQQGYDYGQKMADFKAQQQQFDTDRQAYQSKLDQYGDIDKYAAENPEWWSHVEEAWNQREQLQQTIDPNNPINKELQTLKSELDDLRQFKNDLVTQKETETRTKEDAALTNEITDIRKQYSHMDWDSKNEAGDNLEYQVLRFASEKGITDFAAAFKLYNHDRLLSMAQEKGKEESAKTLQKQTRLGNMGVKPKKPADGFSTSTNTRAKTYDDLVQEALTEMGADS